jgi:hypothetical protein
LTQHRRASAACECNTAGGNNLAAGARQAAEGGMSLRDELVTLLAGAVLAALLLAVWPA